MDASTPYSARRASLTLYACASIAFAFLLLLVSAHSVQAQDEDQSLEILNDSVSHTLGKDERAFDAQVYVRNASTLESDNLEEVLKFSVVARNSDKVVIEPPVPAIEGRSPGSTDAGPLKPYSVAPVNLEIPVSDLEEKSFSGYLVVSSKKEGSAVEPGTTPLELKKPIARGAELEGWKWFPPFYGPSWMLLSAFAAALAVVFLSYVLPGREMPSLGSRLGATLELDAKSWTSVLTLVAALVGALAVENVFPEETALFTQQEVAGMSLFFGATLIFAPVIYNLVRPPKEVQLDTPADTATRITGEFKGTNGLLKSAFGGTVKLRQSAPKTPNNTTPKNVGFVATYLVAATLILTAVLGQLLIAGLYLAQIEEALPVWSRRVLGFAVAVTVVFVVVYAWSKIRADCEKRKKQENIEDEVPNETWIKPQPSIKMP